MVSDVVCPWCWLGKKRLDAALEARPTIAAEVFFAPYQLDPNVPIDGVDYRAYMRAKFGDRTDNRFAQMRRHLEEAGPREGADFRFDQITIRPNTINAHRLIRWAQGQNKGEAAKEALFRAYFHDGRDIGAADELAAIAANIGLDADLVRKLLAGDADRSAVQTEAAHFATQGVSGVPTFIFQRKYAVTGAQETDVLVQAIDQILALEAQN